MHARIKTLNCGLRLVLLVSVAHSTDVYFLSYHIIRLISPTIITIRKFSDLPASLISCMQDDAEIDISNIVPPITVPDIEPSNVKTVYDVCVSAAHRKRPAPYAYDALINLLSKTKEYVICDSRDNLDSVYNVFNFYAYICMKDSSINCSGWY